MLITNIQAFKESTAFELCTLETVHPVFASDAIASVDFRDPNGGISIKVSMFDGTSDRAVDELKNRLCPLLFLAGWKILDLFLEFALSSAGARPARNGEWSIVEKGRHASCGHGDRVVLGCSQEIWQAILNAYVKAIEHRHCLVHRAVKVDPDTGTLDAVDKKQNSLHSLTREQQIAFVNVATLVARGVLNGGVDRRFEEHLKAHLNKLIIHADSSQIHAPVVRASVEIYIALKGEHGAYFLDMTGVLDRARKALPGDAHFDVFVDVPGGGGKRLFGYGEDFPPGKLTVDPEALPPWLRAFD